MKVKEESEKGGLNLNIEKTKIITKTQFLSVFLSLKWVNLDFMKHFEISEVLA